MSGLLSTKAPLLQQPNYCLSTYKKKCVKVGAAVATCSRAFVPPLIFTEGQYCGRISLDGTRVEKRSYTAAGRQRLVFQCSAFKDDESSFDAFLAQTAHNLSSESGEAVAELNFSKRLALAWSILFPLALKRESSSNADVAKQRLRMILISDRCSVNDEAKRRIVNNIVGALADCVEIESEDKVQLTVCSDPSLGTVYSVTVPVRRVKPAYQDYSRELQNVALAEEFDDEFQTLDIESEYSDVIDSTQA